MQDLSHSTGYLRLYATKIKLIGMLVVHYYYNMPNKFPNIYCKNFQLRFSALVHCCETSKK